MCGIVGYIGTDPGLFIMLDGLQRMEYRGYDSAGIAYCGDDSSTLNVMKRVGGIEVLQNALKLELRDFKNSGDMFVGIGHTRWATHGSVTETNAHPQTNASKSLAVIHNGIIENHGLLKKQLQGSGYVFVSETDTEVIVQLLDFYYGMSNNLEVALRQVSEKLMGAYSILVISSKEPDKIVGIRYGSPLLIGKGKHGNLFASDVNALIRHTQDVIYLDENEITVLYANQFRITNAWNKIVHKKLNFLDITVEDSNKNSHPHYMHKEIFEQKKTILNAIRGRVNEEEGNSILSALTNLRKDIPGIHRIIITGMGSSYYAGMIGKYLIEDLARIPTEVAYAAELRYRNPILDHRTLVIVISQSGETADTLATLREIKLKGTKVLSICNTVMSGIARESHEGIYLHAGPEIGVASTKCFTSELLVLFLIALHLGRASNLNANQGKRLISSLMNVADAVEETLATVERQVQQCLPVFENAGNVLYLGRGYNFPVALEGSLKLKEVAYIHAEGYHAAEMKHGPIALIEKGMPIVFMALRDSLYEKILSNIEEVQARGGVVVAIVTQGDNDLHNKVSKVIEIPQVPEYLSPILSVIPLQFLAYQIAVSRGHNVDKPRNLAKSVTVE